MRDGILNLLWRQVTQEMDSTMLKLIDAGEAARCIVRGVAQNQAVIIFPRNARPAWWLERLNLSLVNGMSSRMIRNFRSLRNPS